MIEVEATGVHAGYGARPVLQGVDLQIPAGRVSVVVGANGCGKSTLLRCLARLHPLSSGSIRLGTTALDALPARTLAQQLAFLPQSPQAPVGLSVEALVAFGRHPYRGLFGRWSAADRDAVRRALQETDLSDFAQRPLEELSGGQRQRAWLAMTLAQQTPLLLLDEPASMLDPGHQLELLALIRRLADAGRTIVMVLHDLTAARHADQLIALDQGRLAACGTPRDVLTPALLHRLYGIDSHVLQAPDGSPVVVPLRATSLSETRSTP
jgi:ABC-type cobalamin/Fe3+-siderophores transport system ATPase subunit